MLYDMQIEWDDPDLANEATPLTSTPSDGRSRCITDLIDGPAMRRQANVPRVPAAVIAAGHALATEHTPLPYRLTIRTYQPRRVGYRTGDTSHGTYHVMWEGTGPTERTTSP